MAPTQVPWRRLTSAVSAGALVLSGLTVVSAQEAYADTVNQESGASQATGGVSHHIDNVFWWTPEDSGSSDFTPQLLGATTGNEAHTSTTTFNLGESEVAITCSISNLGPSGLVTKMPKNTSKGAWNGEGLGNLYNVLPEGSTNPAQNLLANGLAFPLARSNPIGRVYMPAGVKAEYEAGITDGPWATQVRNFNGIIDDEGNIIQWPAWPNKVDFDISCSVSVDGDEVPVDGLVFADAESNSYVASSAVPYEYFDVTPKGDGAEDAKWYVLDQWAGCDSSAEVIVNENNTLRAQVPASAASSVGECGGPNGGPTAVVMVSDVKQAHVTIEDRVASASAIAVGVHLSSDFGDAPASYGAAGNIWTGTWSNPIGKGEDVLITERYGDNAEKYNNGTYIWGSDLQENFILGKIRDRESLKEVTLDETATGDDKLGTENDEDAIDPATLVDITKQLVRDGDSYVYELKDIPCISEGQDSYVGGWIDWNMNGRFDDDSAEEAQGVCTAGSGATTLTWRVPANEIEPWIARTAEVTPGEHDYETSFLRLRISPSEADAYSPTAVSKLEGEVEDYTIAWENPIDIEKSVEVEDGKDPVPGTKVTWKVTVRNTGTVDYTDAFPMKVTDSLADVLKIVDSISDETKNGTVTMKGDELIWVGPVPAGGETVITYSGIITNYDDGLAENVASSAYDPEKKVSTQTKFAAYHGSEGSHSGRPGERGRYRYVHRHREERR